MVVSNFETVAISFWLSGNLIRLTRYCNYVVMRNLQESLLSSYCAEEFVCNWIYTGFMLFVVYMIYSRL